jgi:hypothetical protein
MASDSPFMALKEQLQSFRAEAGKEADAIQSAINPLMAAVQAIGKAWCGSWIGYHSTLYWKGLKPAPIGAFDQNWGLMRGNPGWVPMDYEGVREVVEHKRAQSLDQIMARVKTLEGKANDMRDAVLVALSPYRRRPGFEAEEKLAENLEEEKWGLSWQDIAKVSMPKSYISRDQQAMSEGPKAPPHVIYESQLLAMQATMGAVETFGKKASRALAQVEAKLSLGTTHPQPSPAELLLRVCKGFHQGVRQLRDRHAGRPTMDVKDEYDVQDVLHAVLRMLFSDVRAEEASPSFAGAAARLDFLIPEEEAVVEVKRSREGFTGKQLGEELIVDVARYKSHPKCKRLVCFVYDPEGRFPNPRGLENDLNSLSTDEMQVVALIEPS